jgi:phage tail-like protein
MADDDTGESQAIWPLPKFHFRVEWGDTEMVFQEVAGLDVESIGLEYRAGNSQGFSTIKMPGIKKYSNVTLKKGVFVSDNAVFDWFADIKMNTIKRRQITISLVDEAEANKPTKIWTLKNAFPVKIFGTDLKSDGSEVAVDSIEIAHDGLTIENG